MARPTDTQEAFELLRFAAVAAGADALLLELEGRWPGGAPAPGQGRLLVETTRGPRELAAVADREDADIWRASFAAPADALGRPLAVAAHGLVVDLPAPDVGEDGTERLARLAREANGLRRRLARAEGTAATAVALAHERDRLTAERDSLRSELDLAAAEAARARVAYQQRVAELQGQLEALGREHDRRLAELTAAAEQAREEHDRELTAAREAAERARTEAQEREAALRSEHEEQLTAERATAEQERADAEARAATLREEHERRLAELSVAAEQERAEAEAREATLRETYERRLADAAAEAEQARVETSERTAGLFAELKDEQAAWETRLEEARKAAAAELERERAEARERQATLTGRLERAESAASERDALREEVDRLRVAAAGDADAGAGEQESPLEVVRRERDSLRAALDATRGELAADREHLATLREDYARLRREVDERDGRAAAATTTAPLWRQRNADDPTQAVPRVTRGAVAVGAEGEPEAGAHGALAGASGDEDPDTFETEPIAPRHRAPGAPPRLVGPDPSSAPARMIAVGVLSALLVIVLALLLFTALH